MDPTARGIEIPLTPQEAGVILTALTVAALSVLVYWVLRHVAPSAQHEDRRTLGALDTFAILLAPVWLLLIALVLYNLWRLTEDFGTDLAPEDLRWHVLAFVGLITALGALVSAPLALIRVYTTERQTRVAEQGHVTDQINKAVAGLGAEKTVKRRMTVAAGEPLSDTDGKPLFEEITVPNIEVRVGAIYALERIAQDSMRYDKGRDHVQIMEILCAYVRENAPASGAKDFPEPEWEPLKDGATEQERAAHEKKQRERFGVAFLVSKAWTWAQGLKARTDIQAAVQVLGRRTPEQVAQERADRRYGERGYRLDLRRTNLQAVDASGANLDRALLTGARLEGATLVEARLEGANLVEARLEGATLVEARLEGADLVEARLEGAELREARLEWADLWGARLEGAALSGARLEGATLVEARLEGAGLEGARFDGKTNFTAAVAQYAAVKSSDLSKSNVTQDQVNAMFGDGSVGLREGFERPAHWPVGELAWDVFQAEWKKWRADPASYVPPEPEP